MSPSQFKREFPQFSNMGRNTVLFFMYAKGAKKSPPWFKV